MAATTPKSAPPRGRKPSSLPQAPGKPKGVGRGKGKHLDPDCPCRKCRKERGEHSDLKKCVYMIPSGIRDRLRKAAKREAVPQADIVRHALDEHLSKMGIVE